MGEGDRLSDVESREQRAMERAMIAYVLSFRERESERDKRERETDTCVNLLQMGQEGFQIRQAGLKAEK